LLFAIFVVFMFLLVGLGNPDLKYQHTRHNAGSLFVDWLADELKVSGGWELKKPLLSRITSHLSSPTPHLYLARPDVFMNNSGRAVAKLVQHFKVSLKYLLIVHDDLDIPFGQFRLQFDRGAAGHHGVESIIAHLGSQDFWRLRIGISPSHLVVSPEEFVLSKFTMPELELLPSLFGDCWAEWERVN